MNKRASLLSLLMGVLLLFIWELSAQQVSELILPRPLAVFSVPMERDSRWLFSPSYIDYTR